MIRQRTLKNAVQASGRGLQSGCEVQLTLQPAAVDSGIVFRRVDLQGSPEIKAGRESLLEDFSGTTLGRDGIRVGGVEHLLAAFSGLGIDNARVDVDAPELPLLDGGVGLFLYLLQSAGIAQQAGGKRFIRILSPVAVEQDGRHASLEPFDGFKISLGVDVESSSGVVETRFAGIDFASPAMLRELWMSGSHAPGGAGLSVAGEGVHDHVEQVLRQRVLDVIGDLYLLGRSMIGAFSGHGAGHALNNRLLGELLAQPSAWEEIIFEQDALNPISYLGPAR